MDRLERLPKGFIAEKVWVRFGVLGTDLVLLHLLPYLQGFPTQWVIITDMTDFQLGFGLGLIWLNCQVAMFLGLSNYFGEYVIMTNRNYGQNNKNI